MAAKRDSSFNIRLTPEEELMLRKAAIDMGMDVSDLIRKCMAIGIPLMLGNSFTRRVQLEDIMNDSVCK